MSSFSSASNITTGSNSRNVPNGPLIFGVDVNYQKPIISNETRLTIGIDDLIVLEILSFNISQKPIFEKLLELARNVCNAYITLNRNLISRGILDVIHEQNMKINLAMFKTS